MKTILFIGGGRETVAAIEKAKQMNLRAVVADEDPACPCADIADQVIQERIDKSLHIAQAASLNGPIDGVICVASDFPASVAAVADELGLPGISLLSGWTASSKLEMKVRFLEHGLPTPRFHVVRSGEHLKAIREAAPCAIIIKPDDSRGARGVMLLNGEIDTITAYRECKSHSSIGRVIAEEFLTGPQVSTEGLVTDGMYHSVSISDRNYGRLEEFAPYVIEDGGEIPTDLPSHVQADIVRVMQRTAEAMKIENGPLKGDIVIHKGRAFIIEVATRLSGGYLSTHQIPYVYGVDLLGCVIRQALGENINPYDLMPKYSRDMSIRFLFPKPGIVRKIVGVEEVKGLPDIRLCEVFVKVGDQVGPYRCHPDRAGVVIASSSSRQKARLWAETGVGGIEIETEEQ